MVNKIVVCIGVVAVLACAACSDDGGASTDPNATSVASTTVATPATSVTPTTTEPPTTSEPPIQQQPPTTAVAPGGGPAVSCTELANIRDVEACLNAENVRLQAEVDGLRSQASAVLPPGVDPALAAAESAWEAYADAECDAEAAVFAGGTIEGLQQATCTGALLHARADDLRRIIRSVPPS